MNFLRNLIDNKKPPAHIVQSTLEEACERMVNLVIAIDVSGSMIQADAYDRTKLTHGVSESSPLGTIRRFDAAVQDACFYLEQIRQADRFKSCHVILFGRTVSVFQCSTSAELQNLMMNRSLEAQTRTDLALAEANKLYLQMQDPTCSFVTLVLTDGQPTGIVGNSYLTVAELLIEGTLEMKTDADRTTLFIQYGSQDYGEDTEVSKFLSYLDDELPNMAEQYWKKQGKPGPVFDACDVGKQCQTWKLKDPERQMQRVISDYNTMWDSDIQVAIACAMCD